MNLAVRTMTLWRLPIITIRNNNNNKASFRVVGALQVLMPQRRGMMLMAAVKELSWCAASDSPNHRRGRRSNKPSSSRSNDHLENQQEQQQLVPIDSFGIVAAMAKNSRVIGVNGKLPWNLPDDRAFFKKLTANKILVIGRRTLEEESNNLCHIAHAAHSIIVSTTLTSVDDSLKLRHASSPSSSPILHIVRSFPEALDLARTLEEESSSSSSSSSVSADTTSTTRTGGWDNSNNNNNNNINCWVAGGERLYEEALLHPSAKVLQLTVVDVDIDLTTAAATAASQTDHTATKSTRSITEYARFPAKYRWDHIFRETFRTTHHQNEQTTSSTTTGNSGGGLKYEHFVFERFVR